MQRRLFVQAAAAASALSSLPAVASAWAAPGRAGAKFILVFLRGAADATSVLVPYANDFYYASRPNIAVPRPGSGADGARALDAQWALHPALCDSLLPLWQARQLAFVPFAGTRDLSRSHFETQDHIELGQGPVTRDYDDGFLNRLAGVVGASRRTMAFTRQLPLSLRGPVQVANLEVRGAQPRGFDPRGRQLLQDMWAPTARASQVQRAFEVQAMAQRDMRAPDWHARALQAEMVAASRGAVDPHGFVAESARVGALMRDGLDIGFIDVGGWDTHVQQAVGNGAHGQLALRLGELGRGLAVLARALGPTWRDTTVVVLSEFGRTFRENGNRGTDHGHGTTYWVLGGAVRGGRIVGPQVVQSPTTLDANRDDPVLTDWRDLLGGVFRRQWSLRAQQLQTVFPGARAQDLQLL